MLVLPLLPLLNPWLSVEMWPASVFSICITLVDIHTYELAELVQLPYSRGKSTRYSDRLHDFSVIIPKMLQEYLFQQFLSSLI